MSEDVFHKALDKMYGPGGPSVDDDTIKHEVEYYLARAEAEIERLTAAEIERLTAENKVLRKGIEDVMDRYTDYDDSSEDCCRTMYDIAGLALSAIADTQGTNDG